MRNFRITALFLAFVLVSPAITSLFEIDTVVDFYELAEKSEDKEQKEKRETESKDDIDESEKFLSLNQNKASLLNLANSKFFSSGTDILSLHLDVLTPPPEYI